MINSCDIDSIAQFEVLLQQVHKALAHGIISGLRGYAWLDAQAHKAWRSPTSYYQIAAINA
jgi:hypothetical protein